MAAHYKLIEISVRLSRSGKHLKKVEFLERADSLQILRSEALLYGRTEGLIEVINQIVSDIKFVS